MARLSRSQDAYDRFSAAVELPFTLLALLWLPVLVVPLVVHLPAAVTATPEAIDYLVWAAFAVEYLVKLYLAPSRRRFFTRNLIDLAVVALPMLRPLRALRLLRLLNLSRVGVVLADALRHSREIFTHRGLHFVLLAVLGIVFVLGCEARAACSRVDDPRLRRRPVVVHRHRRHRGVRRAVSGLARRPGCGRGADVCRDPADRSPDRDRGELLRGGKAEQDKAELNERLDRIEALLTKALNRPDESDQLPPRQPTLRGRPGGA